MEIVDRCIGPGKFYLPSGPQQAQEVTVLSGELKFGKDCIFGKNVVINVVEECTFGDRCVIGDNTYIEGRKIEFEDDFYGYSHPYGRLEIGRGRIDNEHATLKVGNRCTFHDNRIDLSKPVSIGDDVGLSPEVTLYTHYYWQSPLDGYPMKHAPITIHSGVIIGYRTTILPGATIGENSVIGAQSVVCSNVPPRTIYGGNPAELIHHLYRQNDTDQTMKIFNQLVADYKDSCRYRRLDVKFLSVPHYTLTLNDKCTFNLETLKFSGIEDEISDDFRDFAFKRGFRFYTKRPFKALPRRS